MVRIGVSPSFSGSGRQLLCNIDYLAAVKRAGGLPLLLPPMTEEEECVRALEGMDGLLLTGGADVHPAAYGEKDTGLCGETCPQRDLMELLLLKAALERDLPILAICRGMQMLNCFLGGSLYQDIEAQFGSALRHPVYERPRDQVHEVQVQPCSLLARVTGRETLLVNSRHHQGIKRVGQGITVNGWAEDGLPEAVELPGHRFVLGVQWHPESLSDYAPEAQALFDALIRACGHA